MNVELRPLTLGELLDRTFTYYREHFWIFVGIMAPAEIVVIGSALAVQAFTLPAARQAMAGRPSDPLQALALLAPVYAVTLLTALVSSMAHTVVLAASSSAVSKFHLGGSIGIAEAYRSLRGSVARLAGLFGLFVLITIGAFALVFLGVFNLFGLVAIVARSFGPAGQVAAVVLGLLALLATLAGMVLVFILLLRFALSVPALILEHLGPMRALRRSRFLAKGSVGRIFLACLLMYLIIAVVSFTFQAPFTVAGLIMGFKFNHNPLWLAAPSTISGGIGAALSYPILMIVLTLFYFDARVRKEGFDLQVMMSANAPESPAGIVADDVPVLPQTSVALTVFLTLVTLYLYEPVWYLIRLPALNRLKTREKLDSWVFVLVLLLFATGYGVTIVAGFTGLRSQEVHGFVRLCTLAGGITLLFQAFKVRRMIEEHVNGRIQSEHMFAQPESLSGVALFFLRMWYLQFKINDLFDVMYAAPVPSAGVGASLPPGIAPVPPES